MLPEFERRFAEPALVRWLRVPISPYRNYEVSEDGGVRRAGKEVKPVKDGSGYATVRLYYAGIPKRFTVHRLVCEAFHGPRPGVADVAHNDGNRSNNRASNLRWATRKENMADKRRHGTDQTGERAGGAKLTWAQVGEIRRRAASGDPRSRLAAEFGVAHGHIRRIVLGDAW